MVTMGIDPHKNMHQAVALAQDGTRLGRPSAAVIALLDQGEEHVLMNYRHRFVPDVWGWELPGRLLDSEEPPEQTVIREALEETGHRIGSVEHVATFEPMIDMIHSPHHVFVGHQAELVAEPTEFDEGVYEWVPLSKVRNLVGEGKAQSSGALVVLLHLLAS